MANPVTEWGSDGGRPLPPEGVGKVSPGDVFFPKIL